MYRGESDDTVEIHIHPAHPSHAVLISPQTTFQKFKNTNKEPQSPALQSK